jgi:hypothetical protein
VITSNYGALGELMRETGGGFVYQSEIELENILNAVDSNKSGERDKAKMLADSGLTGPVLKLALVQAAKSCARWRAQKACSRATERRVLGA